MAPDGEDIVEVRAFFGLTERQTRALVAEVADALAKWRSVAATVGIDRRQQDQVAAAFSAPSTATRS